MPALSRNCVALRGEARLPASGVAPNTFVRKGKAMWLRPWSVPRLLRRGFLFFGVLAVACGQGQTAAVPAIQATPGASASGVATAAPAVFPVTLTDDRGKQVQLKAQPQRIVSAAPSNTEILFALGLG